MIKFLLEFSFRKNVCTGILIHFLSTDSKNYIIIVFLFLPLLLGNLELLIKVSLLLCALIQSSSSLFKTFYFYFDDLIRCVRDY